MIIDGYFENISLSEELEYAISEDKGELIFKPGSSLKKLIWATNNKLGNTIDLFLAKELLEYIIQKEYIQSNLTYQQLINATSEQIFQHIQECLDSSKFKTHIKDIHLNSEILEKLHFMKVIHVEEIHQYSEKDFQSKFKFTKSESQTIILAINKWKEIHDQINQP